MKPDTPMTEPKLYHCEKTEDGCKGLFYRYRENNYISQSGEIVISQSLRPLKKLSCPGCDKCSGTDECLQEDISCDTMPTIKGKLTDQGIYELIYIPGSRDYETGCYDGWEWEFRLVSKHPHNAPVPTEEE